LNQYFQSCYTNWKIYKGKRTAQQVLKLQAIYKQAIYGDNPEAPPGRPDSTEGIKWIAWRKLAGTPKEMAKRRFITFLAEIDPILIDVMPDEKPPIGFPLDRKGTPICAKCNTKVGCLRPLLDQNKTNLKQQLFENEELQIPKKFQEWVRNALANQRCIWGVHKAISRAEAKPFTAWFEKDENRGFYPYDSISLMLLVHEFIHHHHEVCYEMMLNKDEVDALEYNAQVIKTLKLKDVYEQLAGEEFIFYIPCERENDMCNQRRAADGGRNHTHPQELDPPTSSNTNTLEEAVELRMQCMKLGINPCTGEFAAAVYYCTVVQLALLLLGAILLFLSLLCKVIVIS
jgi:acyl-CoA-binding protein